MSRVYTVAIIVALFSVSASILWGADGTSYERARDAYARRDYGLARIYFEDLLTDSENRQHFPDALYYLANIHLQKDDLIDFISAASRFLESYSYDLRAAEVFMVLLKKLVENRANRVAMLYIREYEFLLNETAIMETLGRGLIEDGDFGMADYALSFCSPSDTVKIMRASIIEDYHARNEIYKTMEGINRDLYVMENYLLMGDTVESFMTFRNLNGAKLHGQDLYRYAKIAVLFDIESAGQHIERLRKTRGMEQKANLLDILAGRRTLGDFFPRERDEIELFLGAYGIDTVSRNVPDGVMLDSILFDAADTLAQIKELRRSHRGNYLLDSICCQELIKRGDYAEAAKIISTYVGHRNVRPYVLKTIGYAQYAGGDFGSAAKNIILSNSRATYPLYVLAECLRATGRSVPDLYSRVMTQTSDSILYGKALRGYMADRYRAGAHSDICSVAPASFQGDTAMIRIYARSLAHCGKLSEADSIIHVYFMDTDYELLDLYGEYLLSRKYYQNAMVYYDSVVGAAEGNVPDGIYYNWALSSFYVNEVDSALYRFKYYSDRFKEGRYFHHAIFKIATLNFLREDYDTAAYYYGLAGEDEDLRFDAYQNQLISFKKAGDWPMVITTGLKILGAFKEEEEGDVRFEIGYASLRIGKLNEAIENLKTATRLKPDPSYYYWLGEAYLRKGDFTRAFHSYQRIADLYGNDEMWAPTARYKTGNMLELLDEMDAARRVYRNLVKERGVNDPIGAEAEARLKSIDR
ncbi:MAG: tetratricopeptide repeat protein [candidate division WOR-3 bacterium]|nr:MAG: tetratricopeptide repeat protein [candidate division WOR-3 bacterium]